MPATEEAELMGIIDKGIDKIVDTTNKIGDKIGHKDEEPAPTGTYRGRPADEGQTPGPTDKV